MASAITWEEAVPFLINTTS